MSIGDELEADPQVARWSITDVYYKDKVTHVKAVVCLQPLLQEIVVTLVPKK